MLGRNVLWGEIPSGPGSIESEKLQAARWLIGSRSWKLENLACCVAPHIMEKENIYHVIFLIFKYISLGVSVFANDKSIKELHLLNDFIQ
jgi:hypothetical protein